MMFYLLVCLGLLLLPSPNGGLAAYDLVFDQTCGNVYEFPNSDLIILLLLRQIDDS